MKNIHFKITLVFILFFSETFAQAPNTIVDLQERYTDYFNLNREIVYLHLNKTSVVPNEDLWLSAYVFDNKQNLPNNTITNLNINIYSKDGKSLISKTIFVSGGKGSIALNLDSEIFLPGNYFIEASTNYMNNFEEDLSYTQAFTVVGKKNSLPPKDVMYDLQLLPEGGHMVSNVINTIGVKLLDKDGLGASFNNAKVINSKNEEITSFKSNKFGIAKFNLTPSTSENYRVVLQTLAGDEVEKSLPAVAEQGITLGSNERNNDFIFSFSTNSQTRNSLENENFIFAIHKDGSMRNFEFKFPENNLDAKLAISKDSLFPGVNTITIFNSKLEPILERLVFNNKNIKRTRLTATKPVTSGDSLTIVLSSTTAIPNSSMSVSILPAETKSYNQSNNIISAFYLKPYVQGNVENVTYYFSDGDERRKSYDLDLLLLTQGWSKFKWDNIFEKPIKETFKPHVGFSIDGKVTNKSNKNENTLFIKSESTGLFEIVEINNDNSFKLENLYIVDSTEISMGILNDNNKKVSKPSIVFNITPLKKKTNSRDNFKKFYNEQTNNIITDNFLSNAEALDTIILVGNKKETVRFEDATSTYQEKTIITEELEKRYINITDYIATQGFRVRRLPQGVQITNNIPFSIYDDNTDPNVLIIVNGAPIFDDADEFLLDLQTAQVESITINKRGLGYGTQGGNGVINITTKRGASKKIDQNTINTLIANNGFSIDKEFYAPKYSTYTSSLFNNYGAIGWYSNISLDESGKASFKILNTLQPELRVFINGMNSNGILISEELLIGTN